MSKNAPEIQQLISKHSISVEQQPKAIKSSSSDLFFEMKFRCLSVVDVAQYSGLSTKTIEREIKNGNLQAKKKGRRWLIPLLDYEAWLQK